MQMTNMNTFGCIVIIPQMVVGQWPYPSSIVMIHPHEQWFIDEKEKATIR